MVFLALFLVINAVNLAACYTNMRTLTRIIFNNVLATIGLATLITAFLYLPWYAVIGYYILALVPNWIVIMKNGGLQQLIQTTYRHTRVH